MVKFIADTMLGTLAKWLRILGFDTVYEAGTHDDDILELALAEDRIILSRDRELCGRKPDSIYVDSTDLDEQILQVLRTVPPSGDKLLTRCLECNELLDPLVAEDVPEDSVPGDVLERHDMFHGCRRCQKTYWPGSHYDNMRKKALEFIQSLS